MTEMIEPRYFWLNIALLAIGTLSIRGSVIAISSRITISDRAKQIFSYIPAAILPAFIAPAVFFHEGHVVWAAGKERLFALCAAIVICVLFRSTLLTITLGLAILYMISYVL